MVARRRWKPVDRSSVTLERLREAFEVYNRVAGKSPATIKFYNEKLVLLQRFLGEGCELSDFTLESVRAFIADLQSRQVRNERNGYVKNKQGSLSSAYISGFARGLRAFSTWLNQEGFAQAPDDRVSSKSPARVCRRTSRGL